MPLKKYEGGRRQMGTKRGVVRLRRTSLQRGMVYCGLYEALGKNNGSVNGVEYFTCEPDFGIFVKRAQLRVDRSKRPPPVKEAAASGGSAASDDTATKAAASAGDAEKNVEKTSSSDGKDLGKDGPKAAESSEKVASGETLKAEEEVPTPKLARKKEREC